MMIDISTLTPEISNQRGLRLPIQTEKIPKFPVVLFGSEYWKGMLDWMKGVLLKRGCISKQDLDIFVVVDKPKDVVAAINKFYHKK